MSINIYKVKNTVSISDLLDEDFSYSADVKYLTKAIELRSNITLLIAVKLKDFSLKVDVLDDKDGYFYMPFYSQSANKNDDYELLYQVINNYNYEMSNIKCFELDKKLIA